MRDAASELRDRLAAASESPEMFDAVLPRIAALAEAGDQATLNALVPEVDRFLKAFDLDETIAPRGVEVVRFELDTRGKVSRTSAAAVDHFGLAPADDFRDRLSETSAREFQAVANGDLYERLVSATISAGGRPVIVSLLRQKHRIEARAFVTIWNPEIETLLSNNFELTMSELDVARGLFEGLRPKEIARLRARSVETVRSQTRAVFSKTGARNALDLAHIVYGLVSFSSVGGSNAALDSPTARRLIPGPRGDIDVRIEGPRDGRPLVFIHGCLGGRRLTEEAQRLLADRLVIALGRPGHGLTPMEKVSPAQLPDLAASDVLAVLDGLGIETVDVLSYDIGVVAALALARKAPHRINRLVALSALAPMPKMADVMALPSQQRVFPILSRLSPSVGLVLARAGGARLLAGGPERFGNVVFAGAPVDLSACQRREVATQYWHGHAWHTLQGADGFVADAAIAGTDWSDGLSAADVDLLFVHGDDDASAPMERIAAVAEHTGGTVHPVARSGHALIHAEPQKWCAFLK